ncbi:MAG: hypothetical protein AAB227_11930 [Pseudomonadota bacterium]
MSRAEQYSWASLAGLAAVFWWFQMRMLDGFAVVDQSAETLTGVYIGVIVASIVIEIATALLLDAVNGGKKEIRDERDILIDARAGLNERLFIIVAVNALVFQALMADYIKDHAAPHIDLLHLPTLFFALFATLFGGEMVKRVTSIWLYRAQAARE